MQSRKSVDVWQAGAATSLVAVGERTMNKFIAVPRRLPSITKHKVSVLRPACMEHQITFHQIAELGLIGTGEWAVEDGLLINLAKVRAHVLGLLTSGQAEKHVLSDCCSRDYRSRHFWRIPQKEIILVYRKLLEKKVMMCGYTVLNWNYVLKQKQTETVELDCESAVFSTAQVVWMTEAVWGILTERTSPQRI